MISRWCNGIMPAILLLPYLLSATDKDWQIIWREEFDGPGLDASKWSYVTGGNGFGNHELQYYRVENISVERGMLVIKAMRESYTGPDGVRRDFTSGRLHTRENFSSLWPFRGAHPTTTRRAWNLAGLLVTGRWRRNLARCR